MTSLTPARSETAAPCLSILLLVYDTNCAVPATAQTVQRQMSVWLLNSDLKIMRKEAVVVSFVVTKDYLHAGIE